jgi:GAF domain-containing protein
LPEKPTVERRSIAKNISCKKEYSMTTKDYLKPFVEVGRALSDGADHSSVMELIMQRTAETLDLNGCFSKMLSREGNLELLSSHGLSEYFLFTRPEGHLENFCFMLPDGVKCFSDTRNTEELADYEAMMLEGIRAAVIAPIEIKQQTVGMIALMANAPKEFSKTDMNFAVSLATHGILAIYRQREMQDEVSRQYRYLKNFQEISTLIHSILSINEVLELIVRKVTHILNAKGCTVRLLDPRSQELYLAQSYGLSKEFLIKGPVDAQKSIAENLAGRVVVVEDTYTDQRLQYRQETIHEGIRKVLSIPLTVRGKVIGVMRVFTGERLPFSDDEIQFAVSVAQQCALAIDNARAYQRMKNDYQNLMTDLGYAGSSY